jgi:hypothetical protein
LANATLLRGKYATWSNRTLWESKPTPEQQKVTAPPANPSDADKLGSFARFEREPQFLIAFDRLMYISSCTTLTNLPRPYDNCGTGATLDGTYEAFGFGTYAPTQIYSGSWYTTNYSMTLGTTAQSTAPVNFGWQETTRGWWCGEMSTDP